MTHWIKAKDGKEYPLSFTQLVYKQLANHYKVPQSQWGEFFNGIREWTADKVDMLYWLAFKNGAYKERRDFSITREEFEYWTDEDPTIMEQAAEAMIQSSPEGDEKKTVPKPKGRR